jgi:hypothetical protein
VTTALVKVAPLCVRCQEPVPAPLTVCMRCGAGPLFASAGDGGWSVELQPVPSSKMRKEIAQICAELLNGVDPAVMEKRLEEGNPPVWLTNDLSEEAARGLVDRFKAMHAPARTFKGAPEAPSAGAAALNLWTGLLVAGSVVLGIILGTLWLIPLLAVMAVIAGIVIGRSRHPRRPFAIAEPAPPGDDELDARVREALAVRSRLSDALARRFDRVTGAVRDVLVRLSNDEDAVGYVAGGTSGPIGRQSMHVMQAAAQVGEQLLLTSGDRSRMAELEGRMDRLAEAAIGVRDDLAALSRDPDAEPDIAGRLERNAHELETAADSARAL